MEAVETRVAVIAIIVREGTQVAALNDLLHQYGPYIVGRMGVPYSMSCCISTGRISSDGWAYPIGKRA